jgi:CheY-like chemotaxis protein
MLGLLTRLGYSCDGVENGELCVQLFQEAAELKEPPPFDLILMDMIMPVLSGPDATRKLRAMGVQIPIIALTGNALAEDQSQFLRAGATLVLSKPVQRPRLEDALEKYMQNARSQLPQ